MLAGMGDPAIPLPVGLETQAQAGLSDGAPVAGLRDELGVMRSPTQVELSLG